MKERDRELLLLSIVLFLCFFFYSRPLVAFNSPIATACNISNCDCNSVTLYSDSTASSTVVSLKDDTHLALNVVAIVCFRINISFFSGPISSCTTFEN